MTSADVQAVQTARAQASGRRVVVPLVGAATFLLAYLTVNIATRVLSSDAMPLPGVPKAEVYEYFRTNTSSSLAIGVLQGLSVLGLAVVVAGRLTGAGSDGISAGSRRRRWALAAGIVAVLSMALSALLSVVLGIVAPGGSVDTVVTLRDLSFVLGGVVHVVALGVFVWLVSRARGWTRPVRVFGVAAAVPAMLSVVSAVWFYGSVLLPVGRLLCMAWVVAAGISLLRGRTTTAGRA
ncbi:hypothetical protein ONA70_10460 [Micromonospora yasonensis]|uniref:hypothetical protein n=1 Tax=Micromonospora yasonensis TaxID=1128667 RepID=UPI002231FD6C|nr:hypothetical protein [Micromonospora yasonensis]MCW3840517.1 hypothetical protein [Micromonospora yasonensis]